MEGFGMSGDMLNMQMKEIKKAMREAGHRVGWPKIRRPRMLMWAVISLIVAAICKRKPSTSEFS